jgi:hypothetical protein
MIKASLLNKQKELAQKNGNKIAAASKETAFLAETFGKTKKF